MKERIKDMLVFWSMVGLLILGLVILNITISEKFERIEKAIIKNEQAIKSELKKIDKQQQKEIAELKEAMKIKDNLVIEYKEYLDTLYIENLLRERGE